MSLSQMVTRVPRLLDPVEAHELLGRYGIHSASEALAATPQAAAAAAEGLGFPVALKVVAPEVVHKSEVGGVRLGLRKRTAVRSAASAMAAAVPGCRFLVQEMRRGEHEFLIGANRDAVFGPFVVVALGGVWVELFRDATLRLAPVSRRVGLQMLSELRGAALIDGFRGDRPVDKDALVDILVGVSRLITEQPEIVALDLNPVIAAPDGAVVVDARIWSGGPANRTIHGSDRPTSELIPEIGHLLNPGSIAVVGASSDPSKQGGRLVRYLLKHGFRGPLYSVNPNATEVMGRPTFRRMSDLPEVPDLACIVVAAAAVPDALSDCAELGIWTVIVFTAGFAEASADGHELQRELLDVARRYGVRLCGPNTAGVVNANASVCATIGMAFEIDEIPHGRIALLTQSGALGSSLLSRSWSQGVGFASWISSGNEADLTIGDYLLYLAEDPAISVIALFVEAIRDSATFAAGCRKAAANAKPIVAYKTGSSEVGQRVIRSHTDALAGDAAVYAAAFMELVW